MSLHDVRAANPAATLEEEAGAYRALLVVLEREQAALVAADVDRVSTTSAEKSTLVATLANCAQIRSRALKLAGYPATPKGMAAWLARQGPGPARTAWVELMRLAQQAKTQNQLNGRLIHTQQKHWDSAFSALMRAAGVTSTYGGDGRPRHMVGGRSIGAY